MSLKPSELSWTNQANAVQQHQHISASLGNDNVIQVITHNGQFNARLSLAEPDSILSKPNKQAKAQAMQLAVDFVCQLLEGFTDSMMLAVLSFLNEKKLVASGYKISTNENDCEECTRGFVYVGGYSWWVCEDCNGTGQKQVDSSDEAARELLNY